MFKKIISIGVLAIMLFSLAACNPDNELAEYKAAAKLELETYAQDKGQDNYSAGNWEVIMGLVEEGKEAVDTAETKMAIDDAVRTAKGEINAVPKKSEGSFYSLQAAYEQGLLTKTDLESIAFYYNDDSMPVPPEALNLETENKIKEAHLEKLKAEWQLSDATIDGIWIRFYYGTYKNCVAVTVWDDYVDYDVYTIPEHIVGGVKFYNFSIPGMMIWYEATETN